MPSQNNRDKSSPVLFVNDVISPLTVTTMMPMITKKIFVRKAIRSFMASNSDMSWHQFQFRSKYSMS